MKFGGSCIRSSKCYSDIAELIVQKAKDYKQIVVVMSAMNGATDQLLSLAKDVHPQPPRREQDMLVSVGERVSIALLAMALDLQGVDALSFTGSQSGIITSSHHTDARIIGVRPNRLQEVLKQGKIAIVAGFQGVSTEREITTLGRGGADTSAVALAIALGGSKVEFYKDVKGVYTEDPKKSVSAELLHSISHLEALRLAKSGAKVLHSRCVDLAMHNQIQLKVLSFRDALRCPSADIGTTIGSLCQRISEPLYEQQTCDLEEVCP